MCELRRTHSCHDLNYQNMIESASFQPLIRKVLIVLSLLGSGIFGCALLASLLKPNYVEQMTRELTRMQVEKSVHEKLDAIDSKFLTSKAGSFILKHSEDARHARQQLQDQLPERIAAVIAQMRILDCDCRKNIEENVRNYFESQVFNAEVAQQQLTSLIRSQYMHTTEQLTREFRIFTAANAFVFIVLGIAAYRRRAAQLQLLPLALTLVAAASVSAYLYIFNQNWLYTLVFNDYVGLMYVFYLALCFAFFCDALLNRGRITLGILHGLGLAAPVISC